MEHAPDKRTRRIVTVSTVLLITSLLLFWAVLSSDALTANLMDGAYPSGSQAVLTRVAAAASVVLTLLSVGGLGWAAARRKPAWWITLLASLGAIVLVVYVFAAIFLLAVAFG